MKIGIQLESRGLLICHVIGSADSALISIEPVSLFSSHVFINRSFHRFRLHDKWASCGGCYITFFQRQNNKSHDRISRMAYLPMFLNQILDLLGNQKHSKHKFKKTNHCLVTD